MSIVLFRVDERLIHGQVVVGWGSQLHPDRIIVVDDELAASAWEQELYELGLPPGLTSEFASVTEARQALPAWQQAPERLFLLTRDVTTMVRLADGGLLRDVDVNIGGIHHAAGRKQVLPYVYLSAHEESALQALRDAGAHVSARDLPGARRITVEQMLQEAHG